MQQAEQIRAFRKAWTEAGWQREPRVSVSRSIFALTSELDHAYFGRDAESIDQVGYLDADTRAIFGPRVRTRNAPQNMAAMRNMSFRALVHTGYRHYLMLFLPLSGLASPSDQHANSRQRHPPDFGECSR